MNWGGPVPGHADSKRVNSKRKSSSRGKLRIDLNKPPAALSLNPTSDFVSFSSLKKPEYCVTHESGAGGRGGGCFLLRRMSSHLRSPLAALSSVLFCSWDVPTFVCLFECVCPSIIFPARLPAECRAVWINETEPTGLLMKACLHILPFL